MKIDLTFECTAPDGKCLFTAEDYGTCIDMDANEESLTCCWLKVTRKQNDAEIFGQGYIAGYNQAKVDAGLITQEEADKILKATRKVKAK